MVLGFRRWTNEDVSRKYIWRTRRRTEAICDYKYVIKLFDRKQKLFIYFSSMCTIIVMIDNASTSRKTNVHEQKYDKCQELLDTKNRRISSPISLVHLSDFCLSVSSTATWGRRSSCFVVVVIVIVGGCWKSAFSNQPNNLYNFFIANSLKSSQFQCPILITLFCLKESCILFKHTIPTRQYHYLH